MTVVTKASSFFVKYEGKEIYHLDYSNKTNMYDLIDAIEQSNMFCKIHIEDCKKNNVLMLVDLTNSLVFGKAIEKLQMSIRNMNHLTKKRALVGIGRSKQVFLNTVNLIFGRGERAFTNISEARKWLVE